MDHFFHVTYDCICAPETHTVCILWEVIMTTLTSHKKQQQQLSLLDNNSINKKKPKIDNGFVTLPKSAITTHLFLFLFLEGTSETTENWYKWELCKFNIGTTD